MIQRAFLVNGRDSGWEHFFLALEGKDIEDWIILTHDKDNRDLWREVDCSIIRDYQKLKYRTFQENYVIFIKKRLVVYKRSDLFEKANGFDRDIALARINYTLKRINGDCIERFGGKRIKELYERIVLGMLED